MNQFVETNRGYVNLAHVRKIKTQQKAGTRISGVVYTFYDADGAELGASPYSPSPDEFNLTVVAAAPDAHAAVIGVYPENERPVEADVIVEMAPIVAWRIADGVAHPVFLQSPCDSDSVFFPMRDGSSWFVPDDCTYASLDHAKASLLEKAQQEWDQKHSPADAKGAVS